MWGCTIVFLFLLRIWSLWVYCKSGSNWHRKSMVRTKKLKKRKSQIFQLKCWSENSWRKHFISKVQYPNACLKNVYLSIQLEICVFYADFDSSVWNNWLDGSAIFILVWNSRMLEKKQKKQSGMEGRPSVSSLNCENYCLFLISLEEESICPPFAFGTFPGHNLSGDVLMFSGD